MSRLTPAVRYAAIALGIAGAIALVTQFVLPGSTGPGRGTPVAVLFGGLVIGALNSMSAIGLVLVFRTNRVVNFAQAALGAVGAVFGYNLAIVYDVPYAVALLAGIVVSAFLGGAVELLLVRRFFNAPRLVLTVVTIAIASLLGGFGVAAIAELPVWGESRDLAARLGAERVVPAPSFDFHLGDVPIPFGLAHLLALGGLALVLLGVWVFLKFTRFGVALRASAENTERAQLLGINVRVLSTIVWTIAGAVSGLSLVLLGSIQSFAIGGRGAPEVLIAAMAAAVIARMRSLSLAVYAAILIAVSQAAVEWSYRQQGALVNAGLFVVIIAGLLLQGRWLQRSQEVSSWEATEEVRPTPRALLAVRGVRTWRWALMAAAAAFVIAFPWTTTAGQVNRASLAAIYAIVFLSLVVLTGWAGQVSLGQFALVAVGALVGGALTSRAGLSFWLALPIAVLITAVVAVLVGLPALRIRGLFLGVVTFAFASAASLVLFDERYFEWLQPQSIRRPTMVLVDFEDERSMYYLCVFALALATLVVYTLRRSRPGRVLVAVRENESDLQAFGINVVRTKLVAFALGGVLCGLAGVLFAHHQRAVDQSAFVAQGSIDIFVFAVIGGISSVSGAMLAATIHAISEIFPVADPLLAFLFNPGAGVLLVLFVFPGGLASVAFGIRDALLRIVAQRQQLIVPALFADIDPEALEKQLIPLSEAEERTGVGVLERPDYSLSSSLHSDAATGRESAGAPDERAVLSQVAERAGADD